MWGPSYNYKEYKMESSNRVLIHWASAWIMVVLIGGYFSHLRWMSKTKDEICEEIDNIASFNLFSFQNHNDNSYHENGTTFPVDNSLR